MLYCQDLTPCNHYKLYNLLLARPSPLYLRARISYHYASIRGGLPRLFLPSPLASTRIFRNLLFSRGENSRRFDYPLVKESGPLEDRRANVEDDIGRGSALPSTSGRTRGEESRDANNNPPPLVRCNRGEKTMRPIQYR